MPELTEEQKDLLLKFHTGDLSIDDLADVFNMSNRKAYEIYTNNIKDIVKERRMQKKGKEDEILISISQNEVKDLISDERPLVIENGEFASKVALYLSNGNEVPVLSEEDVSEELPAISIASDDILDKIVEPYVLICPIYDRASKKISIIKKYR